MTHYTDALDLPFSFVTTASRTLRHSVNLLLSFYHTAEARWKKNQHANKSIFQEIEDYGIF